MRVQEIMNQDVVKVSPKKSLKKAAEIMHSKDIGSLLVVSNNLIHGIITEKDILNQVAEEEDLDKPVNHVMSEDVVTLEPKLELEDAADLMVKKKINRVPVVKDDELVGIVTASDLISYEDKLVEKLSKVFLNPILKKKSQSDNRAS